jgi:hypothetical protein
MQCFKLTQVLDPTVVHGPVHRNRIGNDGLTIVVENLVKLFEIPLCASGFTTPEAVKILLSCFVPPTFAVIYGRR